jgi:NADH-quinone oxidoreductase subunit I
MVTEVCTRLPQGNNFRVRARIRISQVPIPSPPNNFTIANYDRPHRHFSRFERPLGRAQSLLHPEFIGGSRSWVLVHWCLVCAPLLYRHTPSAILRLMVCYFVMGIPKLLRKVFLLDLLQGLKVTFRYQDPREIYTEQYPLQRPQVAERYRGAPRLNVNPDTNETMCIACDLCALACPEHLIVVTSARNETTRRKELTNFTYDLSRCMFCGLCEDACPVDALELTQDFELASYTREGAIWNREMLEKGPQPTQYRK